MKKSKILAVTLATAFALSAFPIQGYACELETVAKASSISNTESGPVYDMNGNIVDFYDPDDRAPRSGYPVCSSHNWELVYRYESYTNGVTFKVYNRRCTKCSRYKYSTWNTSSNI